MLERLQAAWVLPCRHPSLAAARHAVYASDKLPLANVSVLSQLEHRCEYGPPLLVQWIRWPEQYTYTWPVSFVAVWLNAPPGVCNKAQIGGQSISVRGAAQLHAFQRAYAFCITFVLGINPFIAAAMAHFSLQPGQSRNCACCPAPGVQRCAGCQSEWYCNAEHQASDWKSHKTRCNSLKIFLGDGLNELDLALQVKDGPGISKRKSGRPILVDGASRDFGISLKSSRLAPSTLCQWRCARSLSRKQSGLAPLNFYKLAWHIPSHPARRSSPMTSYICSLRVERCMRHILQPTSLSGVTAKPTSITSR